MKRTDTLYIPKRRRLTHAWVEEPEQPRQLFIYYGTREICFDEPDLLPFGEGLLKSERFRAEDAMGWSGDAPHTWERVKDLIDTLIAEGILQCVEASTPEEAPPPKKMIVGGAARETAPRTWSAKDDECPALTGEAVGVSLELGHLEVVLPVYRIASPALDTDGRQVGEGNANPAFLFLDLPTERRVCDYPGSRFQDEKPMNVTALKLMMRHWEQTLALAAEMRATFLERVPAPRAVATVGHLHALAISTLSLPGYMMVRGERPVRNGELDAGIAALFRLVDGIRMATQDILFGADETQRANTPTSAEQILEHCERKTLFLGQTGVCAGPIKLIREFLGLFIDGASTPPPVTGRSLGEVVGDTGVAIDYGLAGLQVECLVQTFVRRKVELSRRLFASTAPGAQAPGDDRLAALHAAFEGVPPASSPRALDNLAAVFEQAGRMWRPAEPALRGSMSAALATEPALERRDALADFLAAHAGAPRSPVFDAIAGVIDELFALERRALGILDRHQGHVNALLHRRHPPPLTGAQLEGALRGDGFDFGARLARGLDLSLERDAVATTLRARDHEIVLRA